jgi:hypothetical protein
MTTTTIKAKLRAVIFGGAVVLLPGIAAADTEASNASVPDHAEAQARRGAADTVPSAEKTPGVPDHAEAEDRGGAASTVPSAEKTTEVPDHAEAEAGGVPQEK